MKNKHRKLLLLFFTFPFLTASLYNGPHFYVNNYDSYEYSYVSHELVDEDYVYTVNIKNDANYYLSSVKLTDEESYYLESNKLSEIFCSYTVGPFVETTVKFTSKKEITDFSKLSKSGVAYSITDESIKKRYFDVNEVVESITSRPIDPEKNTNNLFAYRINFKEGINFSSSCGLFEFTYDEEKVFLMMEYGRDECCFYTRQEIDLTKLEIKNVTLIDQYVPFSINISDDAFLILTLIVFGVALLISGVIFCAIFIPIRILKRKNKKAKADLAQ